MHCSNQNTLQCHSPGVWRWIVIQLGVRHRVGLRVRGIDAYPPVTSLCNFSKAVTLCRTKVLHVSTSWLANLGGLRCSLQSLILLPPQFGQHWAACLMHNPLWLVNSNVHVHVPVNEKSNHSADRSLPCLLRSTLNQKWICLFMVPDAYVVKLLDNFFSGRIASCDKISGIRWSVSLVHFPHRLSVRQARGYCLRLWIFHWPYVAAAKAQSWCLYFIFSFQTCETRLRESIL